MDTQPTPQLSPEQSIGGGLDSVPQPIVPELNASTPQNNSGQPVQNVAQPPLTAADVAAAMAAVPNQPPLVQSDLAPLSAADQDVIEPEWVDRAEQVVLDTAGNPFAEEEGIESLQIDYLKQRYGYEVKKPENG